MMILFSSTASWGQKIKYKDLFFLIHKSKKYDQGEPFLRSFLSNPKNSEHANANFQMGVIYEINSKKKDVLTENSDKISLLDSAVYHYSKAKLLITEKEVKKRSEYYEDDFLRRDLRTGKMGVKVSDVHLDIDKRTEKAKQSIVNLKSIDLHFNKAKENYLVAFDTYTALVGKYNTQRVFLLRADDEVLAICDEILAAYDSAMGDFASYKLEIAKIEKTDYNQSLNVLKIEDVKKGGDKEADFYATSVDVYDFSNWAINVKYMVADVIRPIKTKLISYDKRLDRTKEQLFKDSVSVIAKVDLERDHELYKQMLTFDSQAMPLRLLDLKQQELKYWSYIFSNRDQKDSSNVSYQIEMATSELESIKAVDSLANILLGYNLAIEIENYKEYANTQYEGISGLQRFIKQKLNFAQAENKYRENILDAKKERSRWLMYGSDSIPLFKRDSTQLIAAGKTQYIMLGMSPEDNPTPFTYGIKYDSVGTSAVYVSVIPDSLSVIEVATHELVLPEFGVESFDSLAVLTEHEPALKLTYLLYLDNSTYKQTHKKAKLTSVNAAGQVLWSKELELVYPVDNISIYDKGGISINYDVSYIDTSNSAKLVSRLLVSTDGEILN
jgi:hypothetical protein